LTHFRPDVGERGAIEVVLREDTYQSLRRDEARARFTFMHELAHARLHAEDLVRRGRLPHFHASFRRAGGRPSHRTFQDTEWQANVWASAFLMPARELLHLEMSSQLRTPILQKIFGVSAEAAAYRLATFLSRKGELAA
jgi:Zn-dependent peptidase ImmA (M78 family)